MPSEHDVQNMLIWLRDNGFAVRRVRVGEFEFEGFDMLAGPTAQDREIEVEREEIDDPYPDTTLGKIARELGQPPPPGPRGRSDE